MPTLAEVNATDRAGFTAMLGHLFEHSPWVAEETWLRRPFRDVQHLHAELCATMRRAARQRQLALIRAHPDLAGRLARPRVGLETSSPSNGQRKLTTDSAREQASAGLTKLTDQELAEFQDLNDAYRVRFGFPFIICARLNAKDQILLAMKHRTTNSAEVEFDTALGEIEKIAQLRLMDFLET